MHCLHRDNKNVDTENCQVVLIGISDIGFKHCDIYKIALVKITIIVYFNID